MLQDGSVDGAKINSTFDISAKTVTLPASVSGLGTGITNAQLAVKKYSVKRKYS